MKNKIKHILFFLLLFVSTLASSQTGGCNIQAFEELNKLCEESQEVFDIITKGSDTEINIWMKFLSDDPVQGNLLARFSKLNTDEKIEFIRKYSNLGDDELAKIDDFKALLRTPYNIGKLNLGKFIKKIGDYEIYENGEVFYRAMSEKHYNRLLKGEGIIGTGETFTSPTINYIKSGGYNGIIVKLQLKTGTLDELMKKALINDDSPYIKQIFNKNLPKSPSEINKWTTRDYVLFKTERVKGANMQQVNIGLGNGNALIDFNKRIINFEKIE